MNNKEIYGILKRLQNSLLEMDECIRQLMARIPNEEATQGSYVMERSLSVTPACFKGKKPLAILYPDGTEVEVHTWKQVASQLMRGCAEDESMASKLEDLSGRIFGRDRIILGKTGEGMDVPLKIKDNIYLEAKFDTESLLKVITNRIFDPIGYDYQDIRLQVIDPMMQAWMERSNAEEMLTEESDENESEDEGFSQTM